jgi:hypothetical protein
MQQKKESPTGGDFNEGLTASDLQKRHLKHLHWALKFIALMPFDKLRPGELLTLKEDLYEFTIVAQVFPQVTKSEHSLENCYQDKFVKEISLDDLQAILQYMHQLFNALLHRQPACIGALATKATLRLIFSSLQSPAELGLSVYDKVEAACVATVLHLIGSMVRQEQFLRCPECGTIFLSSRKPRPDRRHHCSLKCSRGAASRRYREKLEARRNERERARRRYEGKIRQKYPNARIRKQRKLVDSE